MNYLIVHKYHTTKKCAYDLLYYCLLLDNYLYYLDSLLYKFCYLLIILNLILQTHMVRTIITLLR